MSVAESSAVEAPTWRDRSFARASPWPRSAGAPAAPPRRSAPTSRRSASKLAHSVEALRGKVTELTDWRRQVREHRRELIIGAAVVGFAVGARDGAAPPPIGAFAITRSSHRCKAGSCWVGVGAFEFRDVCRPSVAAPSRERRIGSGGRNSDAFRSERADDEADFRTNRRDARLPSQSTPPLTAMPCPNARRR